MRRYESYHRNNSTSYNGSSYNIQIIYDVELRNHVTKIISKEDMKIED